MGALDGTVALVTGAGGGLGRAHAVALGAEGAAVVVNDLDATGTHETVDAVRAAGGSAEAYVAALSSVADGRAAVDVTIDRFGKIDVVVNNAGVSVRAPIGDLDDGALDQHLGPHVRTTVGTAAAAFPLMREQGGGCIVNTVSGHAFEPRASGSAAYATAKGGVFGFTRAAAEEGRADGIVVYAIAPLALTRMSEEYLARVPDARTRLAPERVSRVVVWLVQERPASFSGRVLRIEGDEVGEYEVGLGAMVPFDRIAEVVR